MNDHPESFPDPEEDPSSVPFEEVVKGLEGLGADVEREEAQRTDQERREREARERRERPADGPDEDGPQPPFAGMPPLPGPEQLQELLGAFGLGGGPGGVPDFSQLDLGKLAAGLGDQIPGLDPQMLAMVMGRIQSLINSGEGPVNWALAKDIARGASASTAGPVPHRRRTGLARGRGAAGRALAGRGVRTAGGHHRRAGLEPRGVDRADAAGVEAPGRAGGAGHDRRDDRDAADRRPRRCRARWAR